MSMDGQQQGKRIRTRRVRIYPVHPLKEALGVARAIQEANSGLPFDRILLAGELNTTPSSSGFTMRLNSSSRYGLTVGGYNDPRISLTDAGRATVLPTSEEERRRVLVECALRPEVFRAFYESLDGKRLPEKAFSRNILERDHNIDPELTEECLNIIISNGKFVGMLRDVGGSLWVGLKGLLGNSLNRVSFEGLQTADCADTQIGQTKPDGSALDIRPDTAVRSTKVFIGHFGSSEIAKTVAFLLTDFGIDHSAADLGKNRMAPIPPEISHAMRECSAAVLIAGAKPQNDTSEAQLLGFMVGAASVLYGQRLVVVQAGGSPQSEVAGLKVHSLCLSTGPDVPPLSEDGSSQLSLLKALNEAGVIKVTG